MASIVCRALGHVDVSQKVCVITGANTGLGRGLHPFTLELNLSNSRTPS